MANLFSENPTTVAQWWAAAGVPAEYRGMTVITSQVIEDTRPLELGDLSGFTHLTMSVTCHGEHRFHVQLLDGPQEVMFFGGSSCGGPDLNYGSHDIKNLRRASITVKLLPGGPFTLSVFGRPAPSRASLTRPETPAPRASRRHGMTSEPG